MRFFAPFATLLAAASVAFAASAEFKLTTYSHYLPLDSAHVYSQRGLLYVGSNETALVATLSGCGELKFSDGTYAVVTHEGYLATGSRDEASNGFTLESGNLYYRGRSDFVAVYWRYQYLVRAPTWDNGNRFYIKMESVKHGSKLNYTLNSSCHYNTPTATLYTTLYPDSTTSTLSASLLPPAATT